MIMMAIVANDNENIFNTISANVTGNAESSSSFR